MAPTLYGFAGNPRTLAVRAAAEYSGVEVSYSEIENIMDKDNLPKEFVSKFPLTKCPALEDGSNKVTETIAVAFVQTRAAHILQGRNADFKLFNLAVANQNGDMLSLFGKTIDEKTKVLEWSSWANSLLLPTLGEWFVPIVRGPFNKKASEDGKAASAKLYAYLDQYLADKTFLVGERISFADLITGAILQRGCDHVVDPSFFNQYPNVLRYFNTVQRQPQVQKVQGKEPSVIEKPKEYVPQAKEKKAAPAAAAAAPAAPKAARASKKKELEQDDEEEEPSAAAQEPKAKHPCEALGKAQLNLEDWKRKYSNEDTPVAMKWLEENLKPDEYSFWKVVYKYPEELTQVFMSSNLIGGFHTRLEGSRKYLFGSACVYGEKNNSKIQGVYMCRGQEWKPVFEVGPDYESYEFTPLDFAKDKEIIGKNWAWEDEMDGLKVADGKVFK